jgi:hypothetical protein
MKVIKFNLSKAGRKYQDNQGQEKTIWENVGTLTEFHKDDGTVNKVVEIPAIGLTANVFAIKPKEGQKTEPTVQLDKEYPTEKNISVPMVEGMEYPEEDINPEDIPF